MHYNKLLWCALQKGCNHLLKKERNSTVYTALIKHYDDVIMDTMASRITSLTIVYSTVYSGADQRKHQSSASLAFVRGIHRGPVNSPQKWPVTRKMFPFDDVIMKYSSGYVVSHLQWIKASFSQVHDGIIKGCDMSSKYLVSAVMVCLVHRTFL